MNFNIFGKSRTEAEAKGKGRLSALALLLSALVGIAGIIILQQNPDALREQMAAAAEAQGGGAPAGMEDMLVQFAIGAAYFMVGVQLLLALIQWLKPNIVIPIILLILTAFGALSTLVQLATNPEQLQAAMAVQPMWLNVLNYGLIPVGILLHIAGIIGANELTRLRRAGEAD